MPLPRPISRTLLALALLSPAGCGRAPATAALVTTPVAPAKRVAAAAAPAAAPRAPMPFVPSGVDFAPTAEEARLAAAGYLAADYPALAAAAKLGGVDAARERARTGLAGPFSDDYGDPAEMLKAARFAEKNADFGRFLKDLRRGDLVFVAGKDPHSLVPTLSGGPFDHVLLCVDPAPPGRFIEAVGITGVAGDTQGDQVRRATASRYATADITLRLTRPAAGREKLVDRAIAFCEAQLGKPYNYTFSDEAAGDRAFYCSSLVYLAFREAGLDWPLEKDAARDRVPQALIGPVMELEPYDPVATAHGLMAFMHRVPAPQAPEFAAYIVNEVLPGCRKTEGIAMSPEQKQRLAEALAMLIGGGAFPRYADAAEAFKRAEDRGDFAEPVLGVARRLAARVGIIEACVRDAGALVRQADVNAWSALKALRVTLGASLPYADVLAALTTGPESGATKAADRLLDVLDTVRSHVPTWACPGFSPADLPGRAPFVPSADLESPSDLALSLPPIGTYNPQRANPVDGAWPFALVPEDGDLGRSRMTWTR